MPDRSTAPFGVRSIRPSTTSRARDVSWFSMRTRVSTSPLTVMTAPPPILPASASNRADTFAAAPPMSPKVIVLSVTDVGAIVLAGSALPSARRTYTAPAPAASVSVILPFRTILSGVLRPSNTVRGSPFVLPLSAAEVPAVTRRFVAFSLNPAPEVTAPVATTASFWLSTSPPVKKLVEPLASLDTLTRPVAERVTSRPASCASPRSTAAVLLVVLVAVDDWAGRNALPIAADEPTAGAEKKAAVTPNLPAAVNLEAAPTSTWLTAVWVTPLWAELPLPSARRLPMTEVPPTLAWPSLVDTARSPPAVRTVPAPMFAVAFPFSVPEAVARPTDTNP